MAKSDRLDLRVDDCLITFHQRKRDPKIAIQSLLSNWMTYILYSDKLITDDYYNEDIQILTKFHTKWKQKFDKCKNEIIWKILFIVLLFVTYNLSFILDLCDNA